MPVHWFHSTLSVAALMLPTFLAEAHGQDATETWTAHKIEQLDDLVRRFVMPRGQSGRPVAESVTIAIGNQQGLIITRAYGESHPGVPAQPETVYRIGSLTKPFTAVALLHLIERQAVAPKTGELLSLETPVTAVLDGVDHWQLTNSHGITLRNLLTMTSNLQNFTVRPPPLLDPWGAIPANDLLTAIKHTQLRRASNSFEYSNTGYFVIAQIIERLVTSPGRTATFRDYVRRTIFENANLKSTGFLGEPVNPATYAKPHYRIRPAFLNPYWLQGSADMTSNVLDLYAFNRALMDGKLITPHSTKLMFTEYARITPFDWYSLGWFIRERDDRIVFSHHGVVPGFTAYNEISRDKSSKNWTSITLLTNNTEVNQLDVLAKDIRFLAYSP